MLLRAAACVGRQEWDPIEEGEGGMAELTSSRNPQQMRERRIEV